jgi:hypothetical protein
MGLWWTNSDPEFLLTLDVSRVRSAGPLAPLTCDREMGLSVSASKAESQVNVLCGQMGSFTGCLGEEVAKPSLSKDFQSLGDWP